MEKHIRREIRELLSSWDNERVRIPMALCERYAFIPNRYLIYNASVLIYKSTIKKFMNYINKDSEFLNHPSMRLSIDDYIKEESDSQFKDHIHLWVRDYSESGSSRYHVYMGGRYPLDSKLKFIIPKNWKYYDRFKDVESGLFPQDYLSEFSSHRSVIDHIATRTFGVDIVYNTYLQIAANTFLEMHLNNIVKIMSDISVMDVFKMITSIYHKEIDEPSIDDVYKNYIRDIHHTLTFKPHNTYILNSISKCEAMLFSEYNKLKKISDNPELLIHSLNVCDIQVKGAPVYFSNKDSERSYKKFIKKTIDTKKRSSKLSMFRYRDKNIITEDNILTMNRMSRTNIEIKDIIISELISSYNTSLSTRNKTTYLYIANLLGIDEDFIDNTVYGELVNTKDTIPQKLFKLSFIGEPSNIPKRLDSGAPNLHRMVLNINNKNEYALYSRTYSIRDLMKIQSDISRQ